VQVREVEAGDVAGVARAAEIEPLLLPGLRPEVLLSTDDWQLAFDPRNVGLTAPIPWCVRGRDLACSTVDALLQ
jgi:hypothetical protein